MSFTETTSRSWFSRLKGALARIVIGLLLVIGCIWLLAWNEGRSVTTYRALAEGAGLVAAVDSRTVDPANEGRLVHVAGTVKPVGVPADRLFGITAEGAVGVERIVEMYQWVEDKRSGTHTKLGGGEETVTTYSYSKEWRRDEVNSRSFRRPGHDNPQKPVDDARIAVPSATIGAFSVDGEAAANLGGESPIALTQPDADRLRTALGSDKPVTVEGGQAVFSFNRDNPAIGDIRIRFERSDLVEASFVGAQRGNALVGYRTTNGRTLFLGDIGIVPAAAMFDAAQSENTIITWLVRLGGLVGLFAGFAAILSIFGVIGDIVPFVGSIVRLGTTAIALVLTLLVGPVIIALAWIAYRPVLAVTIIAIAVAVIGAIVYTRRNRIAVAAPHFGRA